MGLLCCMPTLKQLRILHIAIIVFLCQAPQPLKSGSVQHVRSPRTIPEATMTPCELVQAQGYLCDVYEVTTLDGYILTMFRIPPTFPYQTNPVVFLQHGLLGSCTNWIANLRNQSLAFVLSNAGFDVWMGNFRGNTYSRSHVRKLPSNDDFWDFSSNASVFSWTEMAIFDLPAMIYRALEISGAHRLYYVGHSLGTLAGFVGFSENKHLASKVGHFFALAPVAFVGNFMPKVRPFIEDEKRLYNFFGRKDVFSANSPSTVLGKEICAKGIDPKFCSSILYLLAGSESNQMNISRFPVYFGHNPAGTSVKNMVHFTQMVDSNKCADYDYRSRDENMKRYDQPTPREFNIQQWTVLTTTYSSSGDSMANVADVNQLLKKIPGIRYENLQNYNHFDFIWGLRATTEIYDKIIYKIKNHERS